MTPKNREQYSFFHKSLFENNIKKTLSEQKNFLDTLKKLSDDESLLCEG